MNRQITIGFATEGSSDVRFLESVIQRTFEDVAFECKGLVEILPVQNIAKETGTFSDVVEKYARHADDLGIMVLCIHADADDHNDKHVFQHKITPTFNSIESNPEIICKNLVPIVPVYMTEAWMLGDTILLKEEIGTSKPDFELDLHRNPETIANPKEVIENAIRIARQHMPARRRNALSIDELYQPIGQQIELTRLHQLPSYMKFRESVKYFFRRMNYL